MSVAQKIDAFREALARRDRSASGVAAAKQIRAVNAASYDIAHEPCTSAADFRLKLVWTRHSVAEHGVVDVVVLRLLDALIADAARLADASLSDDDIAAANERTTLDVRSLIRRGLPIDTKTDCTTAQPNNPAHVDR